MKLAVALLLAAACASAASAAAPKTKHTAAGESAAKASLLTLKDLGKGWTASKPGTDGLQLQCTGWQPSSKGIVETGSASSPNFQGGPTGPFIVQLTSVYGSTQQATAYWNRGVKPGLIACVARTLGTITQKGIKVKVTAEGTLPLAKVAPLTAAYRVVATLTSKKQKLKTYFDVILVGSGQTLTEITISSFVAAVPATVEKALAENVEHKIGIPTA